MSELILVHRSFQSTSTLEKELCRAPGFLVWETCRRQIFLTDSTRVTAFDFSVFDQVYFGFDAEEFLIQVLCGLHSPLVAETEVFGQFKMWWQSATAIDFKEKHDSTIQQIYAVVKKTREHALCGLGSQSYGSLLRKRMTESFLPEKTVIDFIGAGQLVEEMIPWIEKVGPYRIWCRDPEKIKKTECGKKALDILSLQSDQSLSSVVVVAAPLEHKALSQWLEFRNKQKTISIMCDFRRDSMTYEKSKSIPSYFHLDHFTFAFENQQASMQAQINKAFQTIAAWKGQAEKRAYVRPFGWDDL